MPPAQSQWKAHAKKPGLEGLALKRRAATLSLAHAGLLNGHRHTSNGNGFIPKYVSKYRGQGLYQKVRAVTDGNVITANGLAPFAVAAEIFRHVAPDRESDIAMYEALYSRGLLDD